MTKRVAVTGSSGLIGGALRRALAERGDEVLRLVRHSPSAPDEIQWDPARGRLDEAALDGVDAVVIEAARILASHPQPATIVFASFTGEEAGLLGSREFVRRAVAENRARLQALPAPEQVGRGAALVRAGIRGLAAGEVESADDVPATRAVHVRATQVSSNVPPREFRPAISVMCDADQTLLWSGVATQRSIGRTLHHPPGYTRCMRFTGAAFHRRTG